MASHEGGLGRHDADGDKDGQECAYSGQLGSLVRLSWVGYRLPPEAGDFMEIKRNNKKMNI